MSVWFTVKEGLAGFKRARLASFITVTSVGVTLLLIGLFLVFSFNLGRWIGHKKAQIELEVFLEQDLSARQGKKIAEKIKQAEGVLSVKFVSKEDAARRFEKEFGQNIYDVLDSNPLPASCTVKIKKGYRSAVSIRKISARLQKIDGVSDIVYEREILALIDHYMIIAYVAAVSVGLLLLIVSVILLYNTVRLTIFARRDIIEIMKLVGATESFIRRPFIIEGFLQGIIGAVIAGGLLYVAVEAIRKLFYAPLTVRSEIYLALLLAGAIIGFFASKLSISRHLAGFR